MANGEFFFPTSFSMVRAITTAAPVFSNIAPIIVPATITIPMLVRVLPKPLAMHSIIPGMVLPSTVFGQEGDQPQAILRKGLPAAGRGRRSSLLYLS